MKPNRKNTPVDRSRLLREEWTEKNYDKQISRLKLILKKDEPLDDEVYEALSSNISSYIKGLCTDRWNAVSQDKYEYLSKIYGSPKNQWSLPWIRCLRSKIKYAVLRHKINLTEDAGCLNVIDKEIKTTKRNLNSSLNKMKNTLSEQQALFDALKKKVGDMRKDLENLRSNLEEKRNKLNKSQRTTAKPVLERLPRDAAGLGSASSSPQDSIPLGSSDFAISESKLFAGYSAKSRDKRQLQSPSVTNNVISCNTYNFFVT